MNQYKKMLLLLLFLMGLLVLMAACSGQNTEPATTAVEQSGEQSTNTTEAETQQTLPGYAGYDPDRGEVETTQETTSGETTAQETTVQTETTAPQETENKEHSTSYEAYLAMSPEQQLAYMNSFPQLESFIAWFDAAKAEYDENNQGIVVTGPIDLEQIIGGTP